MSIIERKFISKPNIIPNMEGNSVDFSKTFDLSGENNDEMLRLFLRKAGLSDEIECLTPEQRKAFIYDIIKSNNDPGKWKPSTMRSTATVEASSSRNGSKNSIGRPLMNNINNVKASSHSHIGKNVAWSKKPLLKQKHRRNSKPSIGCPTNFQHLDGMHDMSKNAFDLMKRNDNILKKYMFERGIMESDITNLDKEQIIRNIIKSEFKWIPEKSHTNETTRELASSNFQNLCRQFPDPSKFPSPESLYLESKDQSAELTATLPEAEMKFLSREEVHSKPTPPPRKRHPTTPAVTMPTANYQNIIVEPTQKDSGHSIPSPPPPPPMPLLHNFKNEIFNTSVKPKKSLAVVQQNHIICETQGSPKQLQPKIPAQSVQEELLEAIRNGFNLKKVSPSSSMSCSKLSNEPDFKTFITLRHMVGPDETDV